MFPKQSEIEVPLLQVLLELGGQGRPQDVYLLVTNRFPGIAEYDLDETISSGGNKWTNRIQWVRQRLVYKGEISSPSRGVWAITEKGQQRVERQTREEISPLTGVSEGFSELYEEYEATFRSQLLSRLNELTPRQSKLFARKLLQAYARTL